MRIVLAPTRRSALVIGAALMVLTSLASNVRVADSAERPKNAVTAADVTKTAQSVDLICLAQKRPIIIRLHVSVDGRPISEFRATIARRLFDALDTDKNGVLEGKELKALPTPQMLAAAGRDPEAPQDSAAVSAPILTGKSRVTAEEWSQALFPPGISPISRISFGSTSREMYAPPGGMEDPDKGGELAVLLSAIDSNGDGRLSVAELSRPDALFRLLDANDDEQISRAEFVAPVDPRWAADRPERGSTRFSIPLEQIPQAADKTALIKRLIQTYGQPAAKPEGAQQDAQSGNGDQKHSKSLGVPLTALASSAHASRFDKNGDGRLDESELAVWISDPQPKCELTIEMAVSSLDEPRVRLTGTRPPAGNADFSAETPAAGRMLLRLASVPLELRAAETSRRVTRTSRYRALFKRADQNNNNYIETSEIPYLGPGLGALDFEAMDRDHNGMVVEDEYIAYLRLRDALADSRLTLTIAVESIDPIGQFDANHDGRLNRAEFGRVLSAIAAWDVNLDGFVTPEEIPRTLIGTFHIGPQRGGSMRRARYARRADSKQPPSEGPVWFQKMDRNHDGEVSLREFLGPLSAFRRLDTNGDGRIDLHEAQSAQK